MAKMRKKQNDLNAKEQQKAASRAAGNTALGRGAGSMWDDKSPSASRKSTYVPTAVYQQALKTGRLPLGKLKFGVTTNAKAGESISFTGETWLSKQAQTRFLASEKKKSGRNTAKNVKRRER